MCLRAPDFDWMFHTPTPEGTEDRGLSDATGATAAAILKRVLAAGSLPRGGFGASDSLHIFRPGGSRAGPGRGACPLKQQRRLLCGVGRADADNGGGGGATATSNQMLTFTNGSVALGG